MESDHPHILTLSPPLDMQAKWFARSTAYTMAKYGMSMCVLGMAAEFKKKGIGINALWPMTIIATAAIQNNFGEAMMQQSRTPEIMADAALEVLTRSPQENTGNFFIDELVLKQAGIDDFSGYAYAAGQNQFIADMFIPDEILAQSSANLITI